MSFQELWYVHLFWRAAIAVRYGAEQYWTCPRLVARLAAPLFEWWDIHRQADPHEEPRERLR